MKDLHYFSGAHPTREANGGKTDKPSYFLSLISLQEFLSKPLLEHSTTPVELISSEIFVSVLNCLFSCDSKHFRTVHYILII